MLKSFTWNAAYASHSDKDLGSLEVGKLADMVLLDKNVMTAEPKEILATQVVTTIIGGEVVYEKK
jgi:predicted amidohydrolase YtcJ